MTKPTITSKYFRIGTSGPTVDGREISADMLKEMAESYDREEYTAQINVEHIHGLSVYNEFPNLGEVIELKTDKDTKGRVVLMARVAPSTQLINMNSRNQKLFPSMEISPNFSGTGKAYLIGLAMTDRPASLGTQAICYAAQNGGPADDRFKTNYFSTEIETENFAMADDKDKPSDTKPAPKPEGDDAPKQTFAQKFAEKFKPAQKKNEDQFSDLQDASLELADKFTELEDKFSKLEESNAALVETNETQQAEITKLTATLKNTPEGDDSRPPATGENENQTDC